MLRGYLGRKADSAAEMIELYQYSIYKSMNMRLTDKLRHLEYINNAFHYR